LPANNEVVLDESPEFFGLFVAWLFRLPEFVVTTGNFEQRKQENWWKENVAQLLEMSHKYEIPTMGNDIGVLFPNLLFWSLQRIVLSNSTPLLREPVAYTLGACFGPEILEERYRPHVVAKFDQFVAERKSFNMLSKWRPEKLLALVADGIAARDATREAQERERINSLYKEEDMLGDLISLHCKPVKLEEGFRKLILIGT
jgi:hypothetical protein